jgi:hypothetical protein
LGIAEQTFYRWRREYGGLKVEQARRRKALEQENARLRRAVADLTLDKLILILGAGHLKEAVIQSGAVRFRPILLTALKRSSMRKLR